VSVVPSSTATSSLDVVPVVADGSVSVGAAPQPAAPHPEAGLPAVADATDPADLPPIADLGPDSDVSMFMRPGVSAALRMAALTRVFHSAKYNQICLCAEYAEDYTNFQPMGAIVPHDLRSAIVREARRLKERWAADGIEVSDADAQRLIEAEAREGQALPEDPVAAGVAQPARTPADTQPELG
jgi:hypothetical protein